MGLTVHVNHSTNDLSKVASPSDFVQLNLASDYLIFSNGSDVVADGLPIPSEIALNQAGVVIDDVDVIVPHYFLADISDAILKEIHNMGNKNKRYVFCFSFDAATASEPVLEIWDNISMNTIDLYSLGEDDADSSWWRGIVTTAALPGSDWVGSKLAGASDGHFLWLNNGAGALTVAKDLYCNIKVIIPANFTVASAEHPIFAIKYTSN